MKIFSHWLLMKKMISGGRKLLVYLIGYLKEKVVLHVQGFFYIGLKYQ